MKLVLHSQDANQKGNEFEKNFNIYDGKSYQSKKQSKKEFMMSKTKIGNLWPNAIIKNRLCLVLDSCDFRE